MGPFVIVHRTFHLFVHLLVCCGIRWCQWWDWLVLVAFMLVAFVLLLSLQLIYRVALVSNQSLCTL